MDFQSRIRLPPVYDLRAALSRDVWVIIIAGAVVIAGVSRVRGQSAAPSPADEITTSEESPGASSNAAKEFQSPAKQKDDQNKPKKEKRGSFIVAPIPISSPAFGSGLLLITAYVFKLNQNDKTSPPSWLGMAGVFTNNGTRGLALGGRLYLKENKYQTTFAVAKGRANLDFFGIGRIPGRSSISVPLQMGGTILFGEGMRNIGRAVFIGPRFQYRRLSANIDGPRRPAVLTCRRSISNLLRQRSESTSSGTSATAPSIRPKVHCSTLPATFLIRHGAAVGNIKATRSHTTDSMKWPSSRFLPIA